MALIRPEEALAGGELADDVRNEDLAGLGLCANTRGELNTRTEQVVIFGERLARIETKSSPDVRIGVSFVVVSEALLNANGTREGIRGGMK